MKLIDSFLIALRSLAANKLRSSLTMLGIIIGVCAVITLMSVGQGVQATVTSTFEQLGSNVLYVMPRSPDASGLAGLAPGYSTPSLTMKDAEALASVRSVVAVAPVNENFIEASADGNKKTTVLHGSTADYLQVYAYSLASGQFISERSVALRQMVVVLGSQIAKDLFDARDPIGQTVKMKGQRFTVVGTLEPKGGALFGVSLDDVIVVPITAFQTKLFTQRTARGDDAVQSISVQAASAETMEQVKEESEIVLRRLHRLADDEKADFAVIRQEQIAGIINQVTGVFTIFLGALASISLLVGSIGIMNIMLVSVTERTREIGIRKAIGAKRRDILFQFLLEAAMLSLVGGVIGIAGGWVLSVLISQIEAEGFTLQAIVTPDIVILAVSVSLLIGIISGIYPAMRAARLNPIDALHYG